MATTTATIKRPYVCVSSSPVLGLFVLFSLIQLIFGTPSSRTVPSNARTVRGGGGGGDGDGKGFVVNRDGQTGKGTPSAFVVARNSIRSIIPGGKKIIAGDPCENAFCPAPFEKLAGKGPTAVILGLHRQRTSPKKEKEETMKTEAQKPEASKYSLSLRSGPRPSQLHLSRGGTRDIEKGQHSIDDAFKSLGLTVPTTPTPYVFLAICIALPSAFVVPRSDILFSVMFSAYLICANKFRFQLNEPAIQQNPQVQFDPLLRHGRGPWFRMYIGFFFRIGILFPATLVLLSSLASALAPSSSSTLRQCFGDIANAAVPHLYLTFCQVLMEMFLGNPQAHAVTKLLTPIGFNAYRIGTLITWVDRAKHIIANNVGGATSSAASTLFTILSYSNLTLATVNLAGWTYNLFVFLLLRTLPQYTNDREFPVATVKWKNQLIPVPVQDDGSGQEDNGQGENNKEEDDKESS